MNLTAVAEHTRSTLIAGLVVGNMNATPRLGEMHNGASTTKKIER